MAGLRSLKSPVETIAASSNPALSLRPPGKSRKNVGIFAAFVP